MKNDQMKMYLDAQKTTI